MYISLPHCMECQRGLVMKKVYIRPSVKQMDCKTRNSSGDETANMNFLHDDIVHILQNTIDSWINSATDRRGYVLERIYVFT